MVSSLHLLLADDVKQVNMSAMNMRQQVYMFLFRHFLNLHIVQILLKLALRISSDSTTVETLGEQPMQTDSNGKNDLDCSDVLKSYLLIHQDHCGIFWDFLAPLQ